MMKKIYLFSLLVSVSFLWSCTNEEILTQGVLNQEEGLCSFEAGFQSLNGRTVMEDGKVKWQAGDEVVLFDATSSARFVALADGTSTMFVLKDGEKPLDKNGTYTAFYPADSYDVANRTFTVEQVQTAVASSFDPDAALCISTVTNREYATFSNLCTLLKVNVPQAAIDGGATAINLAEPSNSIACGGTLEPDGTWNWNQTIKNFRLEGTFEYGKDYYLVIPPQTFEEGFTLSMNNSSNAILQNCARTKESVVTFEASRSYAMGTIFEVVNIDNSWYEEVVEATPEAVEFEVSTPEQFVSFVQMLNGTATRSVGESFEGKTIKLNDDLDFTYYNDAISPIENFKGSFDGQGHVIKNLKITSDAQYVGLFAVLEKEQIFQNLTLEGGKIVSTYSGSDGSVGSVLGYTNGGTIINCHNWGCEVLGYGSYYVSGVIGRVESNSAPTIIACSNAGHVISDGDKTVNVGGITSCWGGAIRMVACYNEGIIEVKNNTQSYSYAGGLSGDFGGYNDMYGCFNSGAVKGVDYIGSLAGFSTYSAYIYNSCYADVEGLQVIGNDWSTNIYNVSRCSYIDAVNILNLGIEYYNKKEAIPCEYRFIAGTKPALEITKSDGTGAPGLGEGENF